MENKEKYYQALVENKGLLNEIDLGESIGITEDVTREIIVQLLVEHRIKHEENRACNYSLMKTAEKRNKNKK